MIELLQHVMLWHHLELHNILCIKRTLGADTVEPSLSWMFYFLKMTPMITTSFCRWVAACSLPSVYSLSLVISIGRDSAVNVVLSFEHSEHSQINVCRRIYPKYSVNQQHVSKSSTENTYSLRYTLNYDCQEESITRRTVPHTHVVIPLLP